MSGKSQLNYIKSGFFRTNKIQPTWIRSLALCNGTENIDCGFQSIDVFPEILVKGNGSDSRAPLGFILSELDISIITFVVLFQMED